MKRDENQTVEYKESWHEKYLECLTKEELVAFAEKQSTPNSRPYKSTVQVDRASRPRKSAPQVNPTSQPPTVDPQQSAPNSRPPTVNPQQSTPGSRRRIDRGMRRILLALDVERGSSDLLIVLGLRNRTDMYKRFLLPAMQQGLIEYTIPSKPNSRLQKYRITAKGRAELRKNSL